MRRVKIKENFFFWLLEEIGSAKKIIIISQYSVVKKRNIALRE